MRTLAVAGRTDSFSKMRRKSKILNECEEYNMES